MMFLRRCEEQGHELKEAKRRNEELKNKEKALINHRNELEDKIKTNSIIAADVNTNLQVLFNEVLKQRKLNSHDARALEAAKEVDSFVTSSSENVQLSCMSSMNELNSISERLSIKEHIKLLEELTELRLKIAEQTEIIRKLKQEQSHLERDINDIKDPTTARHFQEEYMEFKFRENKVLKEFKIVKQEISNLKTEINLVINDNPNKDVTNENENMVARLLYWGQETSELDKLKSEKEESEERIIDLQNEAAKLQQKIHILSRQIDECKISNNYKMKVQRNLNEKLTSLLEDEKHLNEKIAKVVTDGKETLKHFENHLNGVRESIEEKDNVIRQLSYNEKDLLDRISNFKINDEEAENEATSFLELDVARLEEEIKDLSKN